MDPSNRAPALDPACAVQACDNARPADAPAQLVRAPKPLLGFGAAGWTLLIPLGVLLTIALTGYDLRYAIQSQVSEIWGWDGLVFFTLNVVFAHAWASWFWPPLPQFGLIGLCIVLVGLQLHPRPCGRARVGLIVALGVLVPIVVFSLHQRHPWFVIWDDDARFAVSRLTTGTAVATAIWLAARSSRIGLLSAAILLAPAGLDWLSYSVNCGDLPGSLQAPVAWMRQWSGMAMNAGLAVVLWTWGLHARVTRRGAHECPACGYDLRGLASVACPECGGALPAPIPTSPPGSTSPGGPA